MDIVVVYVGMVSVGDSVFCWCVGYERLYVQVGDVSVLSEEPVLGGRRLCGSVGWMWMLEVCKLLSVGGWDWVGSV